MLYFPKEKEELLSKVKKIQKSSSQRANHDITSPQFSPEVISSLNGDETPELVIQKVQSTVINAVAIDGPLGATGDLGYSCKTIWASDRDYEL